MSDWIEVNLVLSGDDGVSFEERGLLKPGVLMEVSGVDPKGQPQPDRIILVGHVAEEGGGTCGCCEFQGAWYSLEELPIVKRYKVL